MNIYKCALFFLLIGCNNANNSPNVTPPSKMDKQAASDTVKVLGNNKRSESAQDSDIDFLNVCKDLNTWIGALQGTKGVMSQMYGMGSCNDGKYSFDLIFVLKKDIPQDELEKRFSIAKSNSFADFNVFAFTIPMKDRKKMELDDPHGDPDIYPAIVKAYSHHNGRWFLVKEKNVINVDEYVDFEIKSINLK